MPEFSVIIPVFNAEVSLPKCLESLSKQKVESYEILLVDDGSSDRSSEICENASLADPRIRYFRKQNGGPSAARNLGMNKARGDIFLFVDSDDYVAEDYLCEIRDYFERNHDADIVFWGYQEVDERGQVLNENVPKITEKNVLECAVELSEKDLFGYTWLKAVRSSVVSDVRYPKDMSLMEDEVFTCRAVRRAKRIGCISKPLYFHTACQTGSLMGDTRQNYCDLLDKVFSSWQELLGSSEWAKQVLRAKANHMVENCQYYYFERELEEVAFLTNLRNTTFFHSSSGDTRFSKAVSDGNFNLLRRIRMQYRVRERASAFFRRGKR